jgi:hypothetical protein
MTSERVLGKILLLLSSLLLYIKNFNKTKLMNMNNNYISSHSRWGGSGSSLGIGGDYFLGGSGFIYLF